MSMCKMGTSPNRLLDLRVEISLQSEAIEAETEDLQFNFQA